VIIKIKKGYLKQYHKSVCLTLNTTISGFSALIVTEKDIEIYYTVFQLTPSKVSSTKLTSIDPIHLREPTKFDSLSPISTRV